MMAVSPNNMAFLLNLCLPVVNFTAVIMHQKWDRSQRIALFHVTFVTDEAFASSQLQGALSSGELVRNTLAGSGYVKAKLRERVWEAEGNFIRLYVKTLSDVIQT